MPTAITTEIGLYYPSIEFKDDAWVKLAALYWDKLGRIVPSGYNPDDSDTIKQLTEEANFIKNYEPNLEEREAIGRLFARLLESKEEELTKLYSIAHISSRYDQQNIPVKIIIVKSEMYDYIHHSLHNQEKEKINPTLARIFAPAKMSPRLMSSLVQSGLAVSLEDGRSIGMHPKLGYIYMEALAQYIAAERGFQPVTDDVRDHLAISGLTLERLTYALLDSPEEQVPPKDLAPTVDEVKEQMAIIALRSVIPQDIEHIPTKKIIRLREKYRGELAAFQDYLRQFAVGLENRHNFTDAATLKTYLEIYFEKGFQQQLDNLKKCLKSEGINTIEGAMNVRATQPPLLASEAPYISQAHLTPNPIVIGAGLVAFNIIPVLRARRRAAWEAMNTSPVAYLLHVSEGLEPANLATRISQYARHFFLVV